MNKLFNFDKKYIKDDCLIAGTDEAGRGPGAGGVYAAAVCFTSIDKALIKALDKINDSKQLTQKQREELFDVIKANSVYSIQMGTVEEIEKYNILAVSLLQMNKACTDVINRLNTDKVKVLVDGNRLIRNFNYPQETIVKGDSISASIAAASILAKVERDRYMDELDKEFPMYGWAQNKGYMTKEHLDAVDKYGLCKYHRKKFFEKHFEGAQQLSLY